MSHDTVYFAHSELLSKNNYDTWKIQAEALLKEKDIWCYVSGEKPKPIVSTDPSTQEASQAAYNEWVIEDGKAKKDIISLVDLSNNKQIKLLETSKEIWDHLETVYAPERAARKAKLKTKCLLTRLMHKMPEGGNVSNHLNDFFDAVDKLQSMNIEINGNMLSILILNSLPSSFDTFRRAIESRGDWPDAQTLKVKIIEESETRKQKTADLGSCALSANHQSSSRQEVTAPTVIESSSDGYKEWYTSRYVFGEASYYDASMSSHNEIWEPSIYDEVKILIANDTWELVERPTNSNIIGCRTILWKECRIAEENPITHAVRRKARVVVDGFSRPGIDFRNIFPFAARLGSLRLLVALSAEVGMKISQLDITKAYLYGDVDSTVYMETPQFLEEMLIKIVCTEHASQLRKKAAAMLLQFRQGRKVCLLKKRLCGFPQSMRQARLKLSEAFENAEFFPTNADPYIYVNRTKTVFLLVIVDDILIASKYPAMTKRTIDMLKNQITFENLGEAKYCQDIEIVNNNEYICLSQEGYIKYLLLKFRDVLCNTASTPLTSDINLTTAYPEDSGNSDVYMKLMDSLLKLALCTRPDIAHAVSVLSQLNCKHEEKHWEAAINVLKYLRYTTGFALCFKRTQNDLFGYIDIDQDNCLIDGYSYTGKVFLLAGAAISWECRMQNTVALSSTEAASTGLTDAIKEVVYLICFLKELGFDKLSKVTIMGNNEEIRELIYNPHYKRSKHIDAHYNYIQNMIKNHSVTYFPTWHMLADIFTKALPIDKHMFYVRELGLKDLDLDLKSTFHQN